MKEKEELKLNIPTTKCKCTNCVWSKFTTNPYDYHCPKYKMKPYDVLFENKECEKFKADNFDEEDDDAFID